MSFLTNHCLNEDLKTQTKINFLLHIHMHETSVFSLQNTSDYSWT